MFEQYEDIEHPPAPPSRGWMIAKILLRVLSIVTAVAIIGICILVSLAFREPAEKYHFAWQIAIGSSVEIAPPVSIVTYLTSFTCLAYLALLSPPKEKQSN